MAGPTPQQIAYMQAMSPHTGSFTYTPAFVTNGSLAVKQQWAAADLNTRLQIAWYAYGGGGPGPASIDQNLIIQDWVVSNYGASAAYLSNPELAPILTKAATEGWTDSKLQAAIEGTNFWKSTTDSQRKFDLLQATDPGSATKDVNDMVNTISNLVQTEGVNAQFTPAQLQTLATQMVRNGVASADVPKQVMAQVQYNPTHPVGKLGAQMDTIQKTAGDYMVPLSDSAAFTWAKNIESGTADSTGASDYIQQLALGAFPQFTQQIKAGLTTKAIIDPYIQQTAKLLELSPDQVDMTSQKFSPMINTKDPTTNAPATMSLNDAAKYVRGLSDYTTTQDAKASGATVAEQIGKMFGAVGTGGP